MFVIDFAEPGPSASANPYVIKRARVPIRGTRDRVPNLDRVRTAVSEQVWRKPSGTESTLFD